jgi:uncharacterized RDD family membrane protein YckC
MKCDVVYRGISHTKNIANLASLIKRSFPDATKTDVVKYLKQTELILFSDIDEEKANKIHQAIIKFGGKAEVVFKEQNDDLFNVVEIEEDTAQQTDNPTIINTDFKITEQQIAKLWKRASVFLIDQLLIAVVSLVAAYVIMSISSVSANNLQYLGFALSVLYYTAMTSKTFDGMTVGGRLFKVKVIDSNGESLNFIQSFIRTLSFLFGFAFFLLAPLSIFFNSQKRGFHDLITGVYVIEEVDNNVTNAFTQKAQELAIKQLKRAQEVGAKKLQYSVEQLNNAMPYLESAGYTIAQLEMEVGISPKVIVIVKINDQSTMTLDELEEVIKDTPVVQMLVNAIRISVELQKKLSIRSMRSVGMEISLAVTPSVKLLFER